MRYSFVEKSTNEKIDLPIIDRLLCQDCDVPSSTEFLSLQFNILCYIGCIVYPNGVWNQKKFESIMHKYPYDQLSPEVAFKYLNGSYVMSFTQESQ